MAIWVIKDGQREGPYEEQDVRELVYEGTYQETDPAIRDGQYDWTTLGLLLARERAAATAAEAGSSMPPAAETAAVERPRIPATAAPAPAPVPNMPPSPPTIQVSVVDFDMPFGSMVMLMVKWAIAAIPALVVLGVIAGFLWLCLFALISLTMR